MTLTYNPGPTGEAQAVELDNRAVGLSETRQARGSWQEAMADDAFVQDQSDFLELTADADVELIEQ